MTFQVLFSKRMRMTAYLSRVGKELLAEWREMPQAVFVRLFFGDFGVFYILWLVELGLVAPPPSETRTHERTRGYGKKMQQPRGAPKP